MRIYVARLRTSIVGVQPPERHRQSSTAGMVRHLEGGPWQNFRHRLCQASSRSGAFPRQVEPCEHLGIPLQQVLETRACVSVSVQLGRRSSV